MCAKYLHELGFTNVVHTNEDFFTKVNDKEFISSVDLILDNPPYTSPETKEQVIRTVVATGKPFSLLLPMNTLHNHFLREILDTSLIQIINL